MLSKWQFNVLTGLAALALVLVVTNGVFFKRNQALQAELNQRGQVVQQSVALEGLYRDIAKALAEMAVKGNDRQLLDMLAAQGLNVTVDTPDASAPPARPAGK